MEVNTKRDITDDLSDLSTQELLESLPNFFDSTGNDIDRVAYLNWRLDKHTGLEEQFYNIGEGYFQAAIYLIDGCLKDNFKNSADIWIFPIMFNVIHGIEVYLKGFNSKYKAYKELQNEHSFKSKIEGNHDIRQLCCVAMKLAKDNGDDNMSSEFAFIKRFIDILYANTSDMTFVRYPIDSKKHPHFYAVQDGNVTIDLDVLRQWVCRIAHILDNCTGFIDWRFDDVMEWMQQSSRE